MNAQERRKLKELHAKFEKLGVKMTSATPAGNTKEMKEIGKEMQIVAGDIEKLEPGWQARLAKRRPVG